MNQFELTYQKNYGKMYAIATKYINDKDAINDIIQEVFVYYYNKILTNHRIKNPKSWLIKATVNKCIDYSKHQNKHQEIKASDSSVIQNEEIEKQQKQELVQKALSKLNTKEKTIAILYSNGMSYKEISEITDIKLSSVGKSISRTLDKLKEILKQMNYELY